MDETTLSIEFSVCINAPTITPNINVMVVQLTFINISVIQITVSYQGRNGYTTVRFS